LIQVNTVEPLRSVVVVFGGLGRACVFWHFANPMRLIIKSAVLYDKEGRESKWIILAQVVPLLVKLLDRVAADPDLFASGTRWPFIETVAEILPSMGPWHEELLQNSAKNGMLAPFDNSLAHSDFTELAKSTRRAVIRAEVLAFSQQLLKNALGDVITVADGGTGKYCLDALNNDPKLLATLSTALGTSDMCETANSISTVAVGMFPTVSFARVQGTVASSMNRTNEHEKVSKRAPYNLSGRYSSNPQTAAAAAAKFAAIQAEAKRAPVNPEAAAAAAAAAAAMGAEAERTKAAYEVSHDDEAG
jgi:hypothetical protein